MEFDDGKFMENRLLVLEERVLTLSSQLALMNSQEADTNTNTGHLEYERLCVLEDRVLALTSQMAFLNNQKLEPTTANLLYERFLALNIMRRHLNDFWDNISLPGLKYMGQPSRHHSERCIWTAVLIISVLVSANYIEDAYKKWQGSPVLLSYNDSLTPIANIPFPAVIICTDRSIVNETLSSFQNIYNSTLWTKKEELISACGLLCPKWNDYYSNTQTGAEEQNTNRALESSILKTIEKVSLKCEEMITSFKFGTDNTRDNSDRSHCNQHFQKFYGHECEVCFAFNMLPAKAMFRDGIVPATIDDTSIVIKSNWSLESIIKQAALDQTVPRYVDSNGRYSGLVITHLLSYLETNSCGVKGTHAKLYLLNSAELPFTDLDTSVEIPTQKSLFLRVKPSLTMASDELRKYSPDKRKCYFSNELPLSLFKIYTQRNCLLECRVNCSLSLCGCVPISLPRINSSVKVCGPGLSTICSRRIVPALMDGLWNWEDIARTPDYLAPHYQEMYKYVKMLNPEMLKATSSNCSCYCPSPCTSLKYSVVVTADTRRSVMDQIQSVSISFKDLEVTSIVRKELITLTDFIANSGGVLGVFTGFSFPVICEILFYLTFKLWSTIKHARPAVKQ